MKESKAIIYAVQDESSGRIYALFASITRRLERKKCRSEPEAATAGIVEEGA